MGWQVVGSYPMYVEAQRAVDRLSDASFPVKNVEIVARDLRIVEESRDGSLEWSWSCLGFVDT
jgi:hypothetical protein